MVIRWKDKAYLNGQLAFLSYEFTDFGIERCRAFGFHRLGPGIWGHLLGGRTRLSSCIGL